MLFIFYQIIISILQHFSKMRSVCLKDVYFSVKSISRKKFLKLITRKICAYLRINIQTFFELFADHENRVSSIGVTKPHSNFVTFSSDRHNSSIYLKVRLLNSLAFSQNFYELYMYLHICYVRHKLLLSGIALLPTKNCPTLLPADFYLN